MRELPHEILQKIFQNFGEKELKQCQITSQRWYTAATEKLYRNISVNESKKVLLFIRTIKHSLVLGPLVKNVHMCGLDNEKTFEKIMELLDCVIDHCPNLLEFTTHSKNPVYWGRLMQAGYRKELKNLEVIQSLMNSSQLIKIYNLTALAFRNQLRVLHLYDQTRNQQLHYHAGYTMFTHDFNKLSQKLHEFTNLQELSIYHHTDKGLLAIDHLIEACPKLTTANLCIVPTPGNTTGFHSDIYDNNKATSTTLSSTRPRPNIRIIGGLSIISTHSESLQYLMRKFPNLQVLKLRMFHNRYKDNVYNNSGLRPRHNDAKVMREFFDYLMKIPTISIECDIMHLLGMEDVLFNFMTKRKDRIRKSILLEYNRKKYDVCFVDDETTQLRFWPKEGMTRMPHMNFIEKVGHLIQNLSLYGFTRDVSHEVKTYDSTYADWFIHLLQHCPNLRELTMDQTDKFNLDKDNFHTQYVSLKKFTLLDDFGGDSRRLEDIISCFASLTDLHIKTSMYLGQIMDERIKIFNSPHTSIDELIWNIEILGAEGEEYTCLINITTPSGTYIENIEPNTRDVHSVGKIKRCLVFDIYCKSLKTVRFNHKQNWETKEEHRWDVVL